MITDSKKDYRERQANGKTAPAGGAYANSAAHYLVGLGGTANIADVTNCATRLRVSVKDENLVKEDGFFKAAGAHGVVRKGKAFQVIVGLDVPQVRDAFEDEMKRDPIVVDTDSQTEPSV